MKKMVTVVLILAATVAMAQEGRKNHMRNLTPEQVATLQTKKMTLALDLTEAQQQQMQALQLENAKLRKAKMEERKAKREKGEAEKPTSEERFEMQNARLDHLIAQKAALKNMLSQEQYEKWEKMRHKKQKHRMEKGKRHRAKR